MHEKKNHSQFCVDGCSVVMIGYLDTCFNNFFAHASCDSFGTDFHITVLQLGWAQEKKNYQILVRSGYGFKLGHLHWYGACYLVAIAGATFPIPYHLVKYLQLIYRWNLGLPDIQLSCIFVQIISLHNFILNCLLVEENCY